MPRLPRWAFNTATILSALLLVATLALWVTSYKDLNCCLYHRSGDYFYEVDSNRGGIDFQIIQSIEGTWEGDSTRTPSGEWMRPSLQDLRFDWGEGGEMIQGSSEEFIRLLTIPDWFLALLLSILPFLALHRFMRRRKALLAGAVPCPKCGYDLRASKLACPECGQPIPAPPIT